MIKMKKMIMIIQKRKEKKNDKSNDDNSNYKSNDDKSNDDKSNDDKSNDDEKNDEDEITKKLKEENELLWDIKKNLKKELSKKQMKEMLELNKQPSNGGEQDLLRRCAFGILFGRIPKCSECKGTIAIKNGIYACTGSANAWSKCTYETEKLKLKKWELPDSNLKSSKYLKKWKFEPSNFHLHLLVGDENLDSIV